MARDYNGSSDRTFITTSGIATAPIALFARFNCDTQTADGVPFGISNSTQADFSYLAITRGASTDKVDFRGANGSTFSTTTTAGTYTAGTWHSLMFIHKAPSHELWFDGVLATGSLVNLTGTITTLGIAAFLNSSGWGAHFDGKLASFALWQGAAFTADTVASLHKGFSPRRVFPQFLSCYMPLVRSAGDLRGVLGAVSENGSPATSDHPRTYGF